jgi:hypothetical protein
LQRLGHETLPTLLAIISVKEGRTVRWDGTSATT